MEQKTIMNLPSAEQMQLAANQNVDQTDDEEEIDVQELLYALWCHILQIIACFLVGALVAFGVTYFLITPMYEASASMYVVSASNNSLVNLTDLQIGTQLTSDYQQLLLSRPLLEKVIDGLNLDMTTKELASEIAITNTSGTRIMTVTVTDADPEQAADIANELVDQACMYLPEIMETETPNKVEEAVVPTKKSSPSYMKNTLIGAVIGAGLCCVVVVARFLLNDTFETPEDVYKYFGVQPLATIPEANLDGKHPNKKRGFPFKKG